MSFDVGVPIGSDGDDAAHSAVDSKVVFGVEGSVGVGAKIDYSTVHGSNADPLPPS